MKESLKAGLALGAGMLVGNLVFSFAMGFVNKQLSK